MTIRLASLGDVPSLMAIERESSGASHWSEEQYREMFSPKSSRLVLVAESAGIAGFLVALHLGPEWELENIAVSPDARRTGIGMQLLRALLEKAQETNSESVFLEVRESNAAARALYEKAQFVQVGRRNGYYADPAEDAVLYTRRFSI